MYGLGDGCGNPLCKSLRLIVHKSPSTGSGDCFALQETPRTPTSPRAPGTENADRQTPNAFLSPPTSGTLFDALSRKRRERRHRAPGTENADRQTPNAFLSPPTSGTLFDVLITITDSVDYRSFTAEVLISPKAPHGRVARRG